MQFKGMTRKSPSNPRDSRSNPSGVKDLEPAPTPGCDLSSDARWLVAQRVARSELFRHSPRLRGFLLFIVERTRYESLRGTLPAENKSSLQIVDETNNKLYLASAQL